MKDNIFNNFLEQALPNIVGSLIDNSISSQFKTIDMAKPFGLVLTEDIRPVLVKAKCFEEGAIQLIDEFVKDHIDPITNKLKAVDFESGVAIVQILVDNIRETAIECTGKDPAPKFGDSLPERILETALAIIGLDITKVITPTS